ncbi:uncharacterized protein LOC123550424 [Mercenaria mercenaria]|uniref:uncharacterized protein LOC123550424 n=1 Tax=Mercenaria mercenaria TaxID=6596 RepID=UPI00234EA0CB|nr:uncharacterized protein LOC123550424 [Mercenaria mercenaria]
MLSLISPVSTDAVLTSFGYPFGYRNGESYKWIIQFDDTEFIKLIFTKVSLHIDQLQQGTDFCEDRILFNEELYVYYINSVKLALIGKHLAPKRNFREAKSNFTIDAFYNGRTFMIETSVSYLTVTFTTCRRFGELLYRGQGFRALVLMQDIPACFSLDNFKPVSDEHIETCDMLVMSLSSMSYFGIDFHGTIEKWIISFSRGYLRFEVLHFDVRCDTGSTFVIIDRFASEKKFCNLNMALRIFYTSSSWVNVTFVKYSAKSRESFRLLYYTVRDKLPETMTTKAANIPEIYTSIAREAFETKDKELSREIKATGREEDGNIRFKGYCFGGNEHLPGTIKIVTREPDILISI